jgi:NitT/TauT family transport system ATP-binding protein
VNGRKLLFNQQLQKLAVFRYLVQILKEAKNNRLPHEIVLEELAVRLPTEDVHVLLETLINWGRYAELLGYSSETDEVYLDQPTPQTIQG